MWQPVAAAMGLKQNSDPEGGEEGQTEESLKTESDSLGLILRFLALAPVHWGSTHGEMT